MSVGVGEWGDESMLRKEVRLSMHSSHEFLPRKHHQDKERGSQPRQEAQGGSSNRIKPGKRQPSMQHIKAINSDPKLRNRIEFPTQCL